MSNTRKEDTTPATKADITLVLEKLGEQQKAFAEHDKFMQAQFKLVFDHIERSNKEMREHFDEEFEKLDTACFNKFVEQDSSLRDLDRRVCVVERRVGVPS